MSSARRHSHPFARQRTLDVSRATYTNRISAKIGPGHTRHPIDTPNTMYIGHLGGDLTRQQTPPLQAPSSERIHPTAIPGSQLRCGTCLEMPRSAPVAHCNLPTSLKPRPGAGEEGRPRHPSAANSRSLRPTMGGSNTRVTRNNLSGGGIVGEKPSYGA